MSKLRGELANAFVGAIVAIARDGGAIDVPESTALRQVVELFVDGSDFELEVALFLKSR